VPADAVMNDSSPLLGTPLSADDATLERAIADAQLPCLLAALAQLTGNLDAVRSVGPLSFDPFGGGEGGLAADVQQRLRRLALDALRAYRDAGCPPAAPLSSESVRELMCFLAGGRVPDHYLPFLFEELALEGDTQSRRWLEGLSTEARHDMHVIVIGAGMSGIAAAIRLQQCGIPFTVLEKNTDVGGTWLENTYPGCRVDVPNHMYSYSFEPEQAWPQFYSTQPVLHDYFRGVVERHALRAHIRFETSVEEAVWDEARGVWNVHVRMADGRTQTLVSRALISAVGQLNRPQLPSIRGRERFAGAAFHSAEWNHEVDLAGKRVAVIGTGASAFQLIPEIAPATRELRVFQRSAPWLAPTPNYHEDVPQGMQWLLRHVPHYARWYRFWLFWQLTDGILPMVTGDPAWSGDPHAVSEANDLLRRMLTGYIGIQLGDRPDLLAASVPDYPPGGKRMLRDNGVWFRALKRDNVRLITSPIREITERGLTTEDGESHEVDVLIYGTGFQASRFLTPMRIVGRKGLELNDHWGGDARAYLGMTVPGFPNLFLMYGPNTNVVVNGSIIFFSECEVRYILGCIDLLLRSGSRSMEVKHDVHDAHNRRVDVGNASMAWGAPGVRSWYKNAKGRVSQNWPFSLVEFWTATQAPNPAHFDLR
jgi:4-hydroxyacetophenone monooxygenase